MRIRSRIALVGGAPVTVAAVIALSGWLLGRSETAHEAAERAGSVYREVTAATAARTAFLHGPLAERDARAQRFRAFAEAARAELARLGEAVRGTRHEPALAEAAAVLDRSMVLFDVFAGVIRDNDALAADMARQEATLIGLTDRARQHASNVDLLGSLTKADRLLRDAAAPVAPEDAALAQAQRASAAAAAIEAETARILTIRTTGYSAIQEEVVQLLAFSIQANDTEQETQNVAVLSLRLAGQAAEAVAQRAERLQDTVRALPMSPLLQDEVVAAIGKWRDSLLQTVLGLRRFNATLAAMDEDSSRMVETARRLDETFREQAASIGAPMARVLLVGATVGLLLGGGTALLVARSISRPVRRLKE